MLQRAQSPTGTGKSRSTISLVLILINSKQVSRYDSTRHHDSLAEKAKLFLDYKIVNFLPACLGQKIRQLVLKGN